MNALLNTWESFIIFNLVVVLNLLIIDIAFLWLISSQKNVNNKTIKTFKGIVEWIQTLEKNIKKDS